MRAISSVIGDLLQIYTKITILNNFMVLKQINDLTELGAFMRTEYLCISVLRVASGPRVKLASCKSALTTHTSLPVVYSTDRSKAVVPVLVLLFVALCFILRGDLFYDFVIVFFCPFSMRLPFLGKRELILVLFVCLFDLCLFGLIGFLFLLVSGKGCGLWLWHSLDFSLTLFHDEEQYIKPLRWKINQWCL